MRSAEHLGAIIAAVAAATLATACATGVEAPSPGEAAPQTTSGHGGGFVAGSGGATGTAEIGGEAADGGGNVGGNAAGGAAAGGAGGASCFGFFDPLDGQTSGVQTGGSLTTQGWTVTANGNRIDWPHQRIGTEGVLELDVTGLGGNQECGGQAAGSRGKCRLWWFGADDQDTAKATHWAATGRTIAQNFLCDPPESCDPNDYIDKVRLGVSWHRPSPAWSDTTFQWDPGTWYHMRVEWTCQRLEWYRDSGGGEVSLVAMTPIGGTDCYAPESDPEATQAATEMTFMIGGGIFGAVGATFKNVRYTPTQCAAVLPSPS